MEIMALARTHLPVDLIKEFLALEEGGVLVWKKSPHPRIPIGTRAGRTPKGHHLQVTIKGKAYGYHRVVYYLAYGVDSVGHEIDHINRDPLDNRPENLRIAEGWQNKWNTEKRNKTNTGHRGIRRRFWGASYRWEVVIRNKYAGSYGSLEEAVEAWEKIAKAHAGEFFCSQQKGV
jgi:hypothetical protein